MDITTFLASLWGPIILAVGVGVFTSPSYYKKIYRDLENDTLAMLVFGMVAMAVGIMQVQAHNLWDTLPQILISLLGWAVLVKGAAFILAPKFVDKAGDTWVNLKLIPFAGAAMLLLGGYLTYLAYFA
jgi:uncharacterized protein YjeT (DUF2065 family)